VCHDNATASRLTKNDPTDILSIKLLLLLKELEVTRVTNPVM
jgi:hypothetical protein